MRILILLMGLMALASHGIRAQQNFSITDESSITVDGTSTVSDWQVVAKDFSGNLMLGKAFTGKKMKAGPVDIQAHIKIAVAGMDGGRAAAMNEKIQEAFKNSEHPHIVFELAESSVSAVEGNGFTLQTKGKLSMAGQSKDIEMELKGEKMVDGKIAFSGEKKLNMKEYDMEPPTAFFGSLEVAEEVKVIFKLITTKSE